MENRNIVLAGLLLSPSLILEYVLNGFVMQAGDITQAACNLAFAASWLCLTIALHSIRKKRGSIVNNGLERFQFVLLAFICLLHGCQILLPAFDMPSAAYGLWKWSHALAAVFVLLQLYNLRMAMLSSFSAAVTFLALLAGSLIWLYFLWLPGALLASVVSFTLAAASFAYHVFNEQATVIEQENLLYELSTL